MTEAKRLKIGDIAEQIRGVTYQKHEAHSDFSPGLVPLLRANNIGEYGIILDDLQYVPASRVSEKQHVQSGDVLIAASSGSLSVVGKAAQVTANIRATFGAFCKALRPGSKVDPNYFHHFFRTPDYRRRISFLAAGANINNLRNSDLDALEISLPSMGEQRRIAAILDQAEALRTKRRQALAKLDTLTQSLFLEMFGDPARNLKRWPMVRLGNLADKFSDGPFGSNLKTEHYVESGVRVIRLQNIGVDKFIDDDRAYISNAHFKALEKHTCVPGDVLVGTMGDPNLRACIQPNTIPTAINKADCVQIRVNSSRATAEFLCGLLNQPSTEKMAAGMILGQTRARIAMGRLRELMVPVPPLELQRSFAVRRRMLLCSKGKICSSLTSMDMLLKSLQHLAFRGEL